MRTHVDIDAEMGLQQLQDVLATRQRYTDLVSIEIFEITHRHGKSPDEHLHEAGSMGGFSMELMLGAAHALVMQGILTDRHAFRLDAPDLILVDAGITAVRPKRRLVLKNGRVMARNGEIAQ